MARVFYIHWHRDEAEVRAAALKKAGHDVRLHANNRGALGGMVSTLLVLQIVPYFMTGFEAAPKCSEEASIDFPAAAFCASDFHGAGRGYFLLRDDHRRGDVGSAWESLTKERFATAVAFERAFGSRALVQLIMFAVLLSLVKIFNGNFLTSTRLLFAMGRRGLLDARLARVDEHFRTPKIAVVFVACFTISRIALGQAVLVPISEVGSLAAAVGWLATCLAFCNGAGGVASTRRLRIVGYSGAAIATMLILMKLVPSIPGSFGRYEIPRARRLDGARAHVVDASKAWERRHPCLPALIDEGSEL